MPLILAHFPAWRFQGNVISHEIRPHKYEKGTIMFSQVARQKR